MKTQCIVKICVLAILIYWQPINNYLDIISDVQCTDRSQGREMWMRFGDEEQKDK